MQNKQNSFNDVIPISFQNATAFVIGDDGSVIHKMYMGYSSNAINTPASLKKVENEAFSGTGVERIIISETCESIGSLAFANCENLTVIDIPFSLTSIEDDSFSGTPNVVVSAPVNSYAIDWAQEHNISYTTTLIPPNAGNTEARFDD